MDVARVIELVEEATMSLPGTIEPEMVLDLDGVWDSMAMVMFVGIVEEETGIELSADEMLSCATAAQLSAVITRRLGR